MVIQMKSMMTASITLTNFTILSEFLDKLKIITYYIRQESSGLWCLCSLCMELSSESDDLQVEECEASPEGAADAPEDGRGKDGLRDGRNCDKTRAT